MLKLYEQNERPFYVRFFPLRLADRILLLLTFLRLFIVELRWHVGAPHLWNSAICFLVVIKVRGVIRGRVFAYDDVALHMSHHSVRRPNSRSSQQPRHGLRLSVDRGTLHTSPEVSNHTKPPICWFDHLALQSPLIQPDLFNSYCFYDKRYHLCYH